MKAEMYIRAGLRDEMTVLENLYCTHPFKVMDIREDKKDRTLHLMQMSSSPGTLDGDEYQIKIEVHSDAALRLSTQSYQRLFTMKTGATQCLEVDMQPGSSFCYIPHPVVPHKGSIFKANNSIYMSVGCSLVWGEVLTCGRKLNDEIFLFTKYHSCTQIFVDHKLIIKENLLVEPANINMNAIGQLEGYTHQATLIFLDEAADIKPIEEIIKTLLTAQQQVAWGITATPKNGLLIRILGYKAEQLYNCLCAIACIVQRAKNVHA